jgi:hypothetical protein
MLKLYIRTNFVIMNSSKGAYSTWYPSKCLILGICFGMSSCSSVVLWHHHQICLIHGIYLVEWVIYLCLSWPLNLCCATWMGRQVGRRQRSVLVNWIPCVWDNASTLLWICCKWLEWQLENWKALYPDCLVLVLFTSTAVSAIKFKFVDLEDGMLEWTYWIWYVLLEAEHKKLGSMLWP